MPEVDYIGVRSFIALLRHATWTPGNNGFEYLSLSMEPNLEDFLPEGVEVDGWGSALPDGLTAVTLRRALP